MGVSSLYISLSQFTIFFFQENQKETKSDSYFSFNTVCSSLHARGWESWKGQKLEAWVVLCKLWSLTLKPLRRVEKKRKSILFKRLGWRNLDVDLPHLTCKKKNWKGKKKKCMYSSAYLLLQGLYKVYKHYLYVPQFPFSNFHVLRGKKKKKNLSFPNFLYHE